MTRLSWQKLLFSPHPGRGGTHEAAQYLCRITTELTCIMVLIWWR